MINQYVDLRQQAWERYKREHPRAAENPTAVLTFKDGWDEGYLSAAGEADD